MEQELVRLHREISELKSSKMWYENAIAETKRIIPETTKEEFELGQKIKTLCLKLTSTKTLLATLTDNFKALVEGTEFQFHLKE